MGPESPPTPASDRQQRPSPWDIPQPGEARMGVPVAPPSSSRSMERVVITGIGLVTPNGSGTEATWRSVLAGQSGIEPITLFDATTFPTRIAGEVKGFRAEDWIPKKKIKEMGRFAQLSVAASTLCMKDAAIDLTDE